MVSVYRSRREDRLLSSRTTMPPPSTVSMVRASRLGVSASKSCSQKSSLTQRDPKTNDGGYMPWRLGVSASKSCGRKSNDTQRKGVV